MTKEIALLPCPHCSAEGNANLSTHRYGSYWRTVCRVCTSMGPQDYTYDGARHQWNQRPDSEKDSVATIINKPEEIVVTSQKHHQVFPVINLPRMTVLNVAVTWALERAHKVEIMDETRKVNAI